MNTPKGALHKVRNPTHGSGWMGSNEFLRRTKGNLGIPPTVVGGLFKFLSQKGLEVSTHCRGWDFGLFVQSAEGSFALKVRS
jgi:hypothetical protein